MNKIKTLNTLPTNAESHLLEPSTDQNLNTTRQNLIAQFLIFVDLPRNCKPF